MTDLLNTLNGMSPLGIIALLGLVIYLLVNQRSQVHRLGNNHLSSLPEMLSLLRQIADGQDRLEDCATKMRDDLTFLRARANGERNKGG